MSTDKTGAQTRISCADGKYTIAVEGELAGHVAVADRGEQRVFYHTEIDQRFSGRGLATILVLEALRAARADRKRVVAVCSMVAAVLTKHPEFGDITDPVTPDIEHWARSLPQVSAPPRQAR
ncbi:GNAT family N-acetyltransferase [Mycobacterium botniense]|uniref:N-acetyltransferase n=1 Tax=Mycobacterium botniense TaxID=84962 RepID=A0A7I9XUR4_9MYCO|nr:GNAT family N-acetyltransferase [Mycobacterium botniense]GFG73743.1 N-acetyltransferase [Mycobacterium botniense]